jgi:PAS domain S-box-containing protein
MEPRFSPATTSALRRDQTFKTTARIVICIVAVIVVVAVLCVLPLENRRLVPAALILLLGVLIASTAWGFRYALFTSFIAALGFNWLTPPVGRFWITDSRDLVALVVFVAVGIIGSRLSERARREAVNANERRAEAMAAQERFRDLVNSVEGIVWEADAETFEFSFVSEKAEHILGYTAEQWLRPRAFWKDHIHEEDRERAVQCWLEAVALKRRQDFEYRMIAADGRLVWVRNLVSLVIENGRATRLRGVMVDVTSRKRNEEALREQANLLDLTHDAIFVRDMKGAIKYWNWGSEELYGWTAEEAVGKRSHELTKTIFPIPLQQIEEKLMRDGRWEGELVHTKKFGTPVIVASRWSLQRDDKGTPLAVLETNNDITERKRAEQAREEIEEQWRAAFESNPTMYFIVDAAGRILMVNTFGADQLGYTINELIGQPVLNLFYQPDREAVQKHANECFERPGRMMRWEARKIRKDGTMLWVRETGNAVFLKKRPFLLVVCEDITEQRRAEEALQRSEEERERLRHLEAELAHINRVSMLGELAASLGHEIKQPIAAAITNAKTCLRWLRREQPDLQEARDAASQMVEDALRSVEIINRTTSLYKKSAPQREVVNFNEVINEIIALLRNEAARYDVSIHSELAADLPEVMGDRVQLQQVVMNLIINSIDAVKGVDGRREIILVSRCDSSDQLTISVTDTGVGLPPETDQIFEAFFTTKPHGTGMGLAISRTIIESHGGRLAAKSNAGRGATFYFTLPIASRAAA